MALRQSARQTNRLFVPLLELPVKRHCHTEALKNPHCLHREATVTLRSLRRPVSGTVDSPITLSVGRQAETQLLVIDCRLLRFQDQICSGKTAFLMFKVFLSGLGNLSTTIRLIDRFFTPRF